MQIYKLINPSQNSHNALNKYPRMHIFVTEMGTHVHISVTKWCSMGPVHCAICTTGFSVSVFVFGLDPSTFYVEYLS